MEIRRRCGRLGGECQSSAERAVSGVKSQTRQAISTIKAMASLAMASLAARQLMNLDSFARAIMESIK